MMDSLSDGFPTGASRNRIVTESYVFFLGGGGAFSRSHKHNWPKSRAMFSIFVSLSQEGEIARHELLAITPRSMMFSFSRGW